MTSWSYGSLGVGNSTFDHPYAYYGGNHMWQNNQNIFWSELYAPTQSYLWNVCDIFGGQDNHFYHCDNASYPPPNPYYDGSTFSCEVNRNNELSNGDMKEIKDMFKCLVEKYDEKQLQVRKARDTVRNLEAQLTQLVQALTAQQVNIVDSRQEEHEFEEELEVLMQEFRVEH
ncbi:hypothetical protein HAX54_040147 [Datura stramonium]|uniref:Uncharacterized protein n=1 Tax=Datura stramonium TaxID=4076 RepID=A0ABS8VQB0_DATST|nr:hypothetical protein [Datura stramonium]